MKQLTTLALLILTLPIFMKAQSPMNLQTPTGTIYGTIQIPVTDHPVPVVLIIAGSGPTDRDGNNPQMQNNSLKMLADSLQSNGIASLRYDKRGIAESKDAGLEEKDLRFDNYVDDAAAWIRLLRKDSRFSKIIVAGHSEGSLIGMIAARKENASAYISIAGAGRSADLIIKEQLATQPAAIKDYCYSAIDSLKAGNLVQKVDPSMYMLFRPSIQPYMISWLQYDPQLEIRKLSIPVLILQGSTDIQVSTKDAELLKQGSPQATLFIIKGMNHILKDAGPMRQENIATYTNPDLPLNAELARTIVGFIQKL